MAGEGGEGEGEGGVGGTQGVPGVHHPWEKGQEAIWALEMGQGV